MSVLEEIENLYHDNLEIRRLLKDILEELEITLVRLCDIVESMK